MAGVPGSSFHSPKEAGRREGAALCGPRRTRRCTLRGNGCSRNAGEGADGEDRLINGRGHFSAHVGVNARRAPGVRGLWGFVASSRTWALKYPRRSFSHKIPLACSFLKIPPASSSTTIRPACSRTRARGRTATRSSAATTTDGLKDCPSSSENATDNCLAVVAHRHLGPRCPSPPVNGNDGLAFRVEAVPDQHQAAAGRAA